MAAAELTETEFPMQHLVPLLIKVTQAAAGDWVVVNGYKGVIPLGGITQAVDHSHWQAAFTYGVATVNGTITAAATEIVFSGATITRVPPYYVLSGNAGTGFEIFEVVSEDDSTSATPTCQIVRGCLGTTATEQTNADVVSIMQILFVGTNAVGGNIFAVLPLPENNKVKMFT